MHINLESADQHSIQAYSDNEIMINSLTYRKSIIVSNHELIADWTIDDILQLSEERLEPLLRYNPKVIVIGHKQPGLFPPPQAFEFLAKKRIGLECMSIGAACRTFNVLLSELREVVLGIIIK